MDTLAPPQLQQLSSSLPSLPTEIVHRIIQLALPRVSYARYTERYDTLLIFARVNKLWGELAQRELLRHLRVVKREKEAFQQTIDALPVDRCVATRSLWVTDDGHEDSLYGVDVLKTITGLANLRRLSVSTLHNPVEGLDLQTLSEAVSGLGELLLDYVAFSHTYHFKANLLCLPVLRQLALTLFEPDVVISILSYATIPHLESLIVNLRKPPTPHEQAEFEQALRLYTPRLRRFGFGIFSYGLINLSEDLWTTFTGLKHLLVDPHTDVASIFAAIPSPLVSFRIQKLEGLHSYSLEPLKLALTSPPPCLASLQHMLLESPASNPSRSAEAKAARVESSALVELGKERGVKVVFRPQLRSLGYFAQLEGLLELWDDE